MLDVAAVAERLVAQQDFPRALAQALVLLAALHDLGKISDSFQNMLHAGAAQQWRHWELSEVLLRRHDALLGELLGGKQFERQALYACTAGHHGRPPTCSNLSDPRLDGAIGASAMADAAEAIRLLAGFWPDASLAELKRTQMQALNWWLPGFVTVADWIGSNTRWFPPTAPGPDLADYLAATRPQAALAVMEAGLQVPAPAAGKLFDFALRPMQQACAATPMAEGPMLAIIEDETGSGKTEAALLLAQRMLVAGKGRGLFLALPTMATADAMFRRARAIIGRMFAAPPSLTLAHGRAGLSAEFRELRGTTARYSDAPICSDWLADNRRRALLATVGVGTIDQALLSVLPTRFATLRHYGLASKILIVDEVHEMGAPYMATELAQLLRLHRLAGGSAILLTATLPLEQRRLLLQAWGAAADDSCAYPALTVAGEATRQQVPPTPSPRGAVRVERLATPAEAIPLLQEFAAAGGACLWVRNAVDDAIAAVDALRQAGVQADLLHARFALADRKRHEARALACFGKEGQGRAGRILVATQVVESSLDLDFDVMVSDLAPMAALVQRAGRLWRHMDLRPAADRPTPTPVLHVVSPDPDQVADARWLHEVLDRGAFVYPVPLQWRTAHTLFAAGEIDAPSGLRTLIEAAHGADAVAVPAVLEEAEQEQMGAAYAEANQADRNVIDLGRGYRGSPAARDTDYPTRLGLSQCPLMLARREEGVLRPYVGHNDAEGWQLSEVQAAEHRLKGLQLPDQDMPEIAALTAGWPEWKKRTVTVCPLGEDGRICDGLRYSPEYGLLFS